VDRKAHLPRSIHWQIDLGL